MLDEIIKAITETDERTSSILRKCLVLSYSLKNDALKSWVSKELNGYAQDDPDLPDYRRTVAPAKGLFLGSFGQQFNDQPIPSAFLKPEHRHLAERALLTQPIVAYETVKPDDHLIIPWPANMIVLYQDKFFNGQMGLNRAWQDVPSSAFAGVTDTVRTRMLTFVLELKDQLVEERNEKVESISPATVQTLVQMTVIGGNNVFGNVEQFAAQTVQVGDVDSLRGTLAALGIDHAELEALQHDIADDLEDESDKKALGRRTLDWIARNAKSAGKGAVNIGAEVAASVMTEAIKRYMGL